MFPYQGIQASEEPKSPVTSSGFQDTAEITNVFQDRIKYSDYLLTGRSEFTQMMWARYDVGGGSNVMHLYRAYYDNLGSAYVGGFNFQGPSGTDRLIFSTISSSGVIMSVQKLNAGLSGGVWHHLCVTGSVTDNELKLFHNGVLLATSTMPYAVGLPYNSGSTDPDTTGSVGFDFSQHNAYNRRLTEAEVAEHYVYDDDLMQSGVLGYDAMTPAQKSGLIYCASFTENISKAGNEFNDKSGSNITISPQPPLTGQQIYVYTDANDLPSNTTIYPVNSANLNGTSQCLSAGNNLNLGSNDFAISFWVKNLTTSPQQVMGKYGVCAGNNSSWYISVDDSDTGLSFGYSTSGSAETDSFTSTYTPSQHEIIHAVITRNGNTLYWYINGVEQGTYDCTGDTIFNTNTNAYIGAIALRETCVPPQELSYGETQQSFIDFKVGASITLADVQELYNSGIPKCFDDRNTVLNAKFDHHWSISNWNGNTGSELVDKIGSLDLTNIGSTPFDGTGLSVECSN